MGETTNNESAPKESRYAGLKAEFNKIVWPDKDSVTFVPIFSYSR